MALWGRNMSLVNWPVVTSCSILRFVVYRRHTLINCIYTQRDGNNQIRVHLNRRGRQFSRLLAAEVCASAAVMLDTPCSETVWSVLATHSVRQFPLHFPSRASPCAITFQLESTKVSEEHANSIFRVTKFGWIVEVAMKLTGSKSVLVPNPFGGSWPVFFCGQVCSCDCDGGMVLCPGFSLCIS